VTSHNVLEEGDCVQKVATDSVIDFEMPPQNEKECDGIVIIMMVIISRFGKNNLWGLSSPGGKTGGKIGEKHLRDTGALKDGSTSTPLTLKSCLVSKYMKASLG
jgi:hypothetical protein